MSQPDLDEAALARLGLSRETDIVLDEEGGFWAGGARLTHPGVTAAFARWIRRAPDGRWALENAIHWVYLRVLGAPLHAGGVVEDAGRPALLLAGGEREPLRAGTLREGPDGALYASAPRPGRDGPEPWAVRLSPRAALDLAPWLVELEGRPALRLDGRDHPIPRVDDPLACGGPEVASP